MIKLACTRILTAGVLLVLTVSCQPEVWIDGTLTPPPTSEVSTTRQPTVRPAAKTLEPTLAQPAIPTPLPTTAPIIRRPTPENWQVFVEPDTGITLSAPADWVNVGLLANITRIATALGQEQVLLVADELETGIQLLTGRPFESGGFALAFFATPNLTPALAVDTTESPAANLNLLAQKMGADNRAAAVAGSALPATSIRLEREPTGVLPGLEEGVNLRLVLYFDTSTQPATPIYLLLGAAGADEPLFTSIFKELMTSLAVRRDPGTLADGVRFLDTTAVTGGIDAAVGNLLPGEVDSWAFQGEANRFATITLVPGNQTSDLTFTLFGPSGRILAEQDSGYGGDTEILADFLLPESGVYIVQVQEFFSEADRYTLTVALTQEPTFSGGGRINFNQQLRGQLAPKARDTWLFNGQAGQAISIVLDPIGEFDPLFTLFSPDGREIATFDEGYSGDAEVLGSYTLPLTGEYSIVVRSFSENGGQYTIALDEGNEEIDNFYDAGDLNYGDARRELLRENEAHIWVLPGRAGDQVTLTVAPLSEKIDLEVWLLDPERRRLSMEDKGLSGEAETITYNLPRDGDYIVMIKEFFGVSGEYEIELAVSGDNYLISSGSISYGQTLQSALPNGRGTIWQFTGAVGDVVTIRLSPFNPESDFLLSLRDPKDQPVMQIDNTLAGKDEVIRDFKLTATGSWAIIVQEYFEDGGVYIISLEKK